MQQLESDLDQTQEKLMSANQRLEEKEKALQNAEGNFFIGLMDLSTFFFKWKMLVIQFLLKCPFWKKLAIS